MMSYGECKEIALSKNSKVDTCREFEEAYHFFEKDNDSDGDNGVVVLKENGKALNWVPFILNYHPNPNAKEIEF